METLSIGSLEELSKARRSVPDPQSLGMNLISDALSSYPSMENGLRPNLERGVCSGVLIAMRTS